MRRNNLEWHFFFGVACGICDSRWCIDSEFKFSREKDGKGVGIRGSTSPYLGLRLPSLSEFGNAISASQKMELRQR